MGKKNKNYSKVWECKDGTWAWVLFLGEDPAYYTGVSASKPEAENEIKWIESSKKDVL